MKERTPGRAIHPLPPSRLERLEIRSSLKNISAFSTAERKTSPIRWKASRFWQLGLLRLLLAPGKWTNWQDGSAMRSTNDCSFVRDEPKRSALSKESKLTTKIYAWEG
jgi:hypothetical protein